VGSTSGERLSGLPGVVDRLVGVPPISEKKLLELGVCWGHGPELARALRVFVLTWDPLEVLGPRPAAFAAVNGGRGDLELALYVPYWSLRDLARERGWTIASVIGALAGSVAVTAQARAAAVVSGIYTSLLMQGGVPDLCADLPGGAALGPPDITLVTQRWEDIGLAAITDIVQHAFGPVDLDRSPVELATSPVPKSGCPACRGVRFGFPAHLSDSQELMCPAHQREAGSVINRRLARADASNPEGWAAIGDASARLSRPHLPNGLLGRLPRADESVGAIPDRGELARRAHLVVEAAGWFSGRPDDLAAALGVEPELGSWFPEWLENLVLDLGHAGLGEHAGRVGDALGQVDPAQQAFYAADVAVALAESGLAEAARDKVAANLARWPAVFSVRLHAGDALAALGDVDGARAHFEAAYEMADANRDIEDRALAAERLGRARRTPPPAPGQRTRRGGKPGRSRRKRPRR
jgi:hypothetical protein